MSDPSTKLTVSMRLDLPALFLVCWSVGARGLLGDNKIAALMQILRLERVERAAKYLVYHGLILSIMPPRKSIAPAM